MIRAAMFVIRLALSPATARVRRECLGSSDMNYFRDPTALPSIADINRRSGEVQL